VFCVSLLPLLHQRVDVISGTIIERAAQMQNDEKVNKKEKALALSHLLAKLSSIGLSFKPSAYSQVFVHVQTLYYDL
jgi:hypothetical protein